MNQANHYSIYRTVISRVLNDSERLPSLPSITLRIRQALSEEKTNAESLAHIISKDPSLTALLLKSVSSPIYRRKIAPNTLSDVIGLLGFATVNNLVMLHSVRSVFAMSNPKAKTLFAHTWRRLIVKTALSIFVARHLHYRPMEHAQMVALLSEVGSLAVLSAIIELPQIPDSEAYFQLCRNYSKSLGNILLSKWNIDPQMIDAVKQSGQWQLDTGSGLHLHDIVNLALYYTVMMTNPDAELPALEELCAFHKLSKHHQVCNKPNWLHWVADNKAEIQEIVQSLK